VHLRIGDVARLTSLSPDSIRHYNRLGLVPATRTEGKFREFAPDAVQRVRVIQSALALGFSLDELAKIFAMRRSGKAPCRHVRALAGEKLAALTRQISELDRLRSALAKTLRDWDASLEAASGRPARLLESLGATLEAPSARPINIASPEDPPAKRRGAVARRRS
jgi:DNA-binding transcriptional MerR regulator